MVLLILGIGIFLATHLFTGYARRPRAALAAKLGDLRYKGLYSVVALVGFVLIVRGWRTTTPEVIYEPSFAAAPLAYLLMIVTFILFAAAYLPAGRIKSWAGHPMALGTIIGSAAHLLVNGDSRSVAVFGAFFAYGVLDRISYVLRGDKGASGTSIVGDAGAVIGGLVFSYLVVHHLHRFIAGVPLDPAHVLTHG